MDFVEGLTKSNGKSVIFKVVDRLTNYAHFLPLAHPYTAMQVARTLFGNDFKLQGLPKTFVCDRDLVFISKFWKELFILEGTLFNMTSTYHPEIDGQTEVINNVLEMYLRCLTGDNPKEWLAWLTWVEYTYSISFPLISWNDTFSTFIQKTTTNSLELNI